MIKIKMYKEKWRILLGNEIWEFNTKKEFEDCLKILVNLKDKFGKIK